MLALGVTSGTVVFLEYSDHTVSCLFESVEGKYRITVNDRGTIYPCYGQRGEEVELTREVSVVVRAGAHRLKCRFYCPDKRIGIRRFNAGTGARDEVLSCVGSDT
jgi:hypothetical protein